MTKRSHRHFFAWLLSLALLLAQQAAMAHLASHIGDKPASDNQALTHLKLCGKCVAVEKLAHTLPLTAHPPLPEASDPLLVPSRPTAIHAVDGVGQSCRDPPELL